MDYNTRQKVFKRAFWMCEYPDCNKPATEIAHRIANTQENHKLVKRILLEKYGIDVPLRTVRHAVIDNPYNLAASCREHNDYFNCGYNMNDVYTIIEQCKEVL